ncbi:MAG: elongation factor G [Nitrospiria bacterium]
MKEYPTEDIRNFSIVGHSASGKTTLSEAMLACSGDIGRMGRIVDQNTVSDYHADEHERQISIHTSLLHTEWMGKKFNIIDTPGYSDFIGERLDVLRVSDFALIVIHANHGVEAVTEQVWKYATEYDVPKLLVISGFDKEHAHFDHVFESIRQHFGKRVFPMNIPVNPGPGFNRILDVMRSEITTYKTDGSGKFEESSAFGEWEARVEGLHKELIEYIAESDDGLLDKFLEEGDLTEEEMRRWLHPALKNHAFIPLFCLSGEENVGVARLMDFIAKYGFSPVDHQKIKGINAEGAEVGIRLSDPEPVSYIFKTLSEAHVGELSFFRIYSGVVQAGSELYNSTKQVNERIGQLYILNGKDRTAVGILHAGDIGAVVKMKDSHTGNTLCSVKHAVTLPEPDYPKPNLHAALKAKSKGEEEKIALGLSKLHEEDPTFSHRVDPELHQTIISGQGELHLKVISDHLKRRFYVDIDLVKPKIPYRETIKVKGESKYRHKKQSGGAGQFAEVWMRIEPKSRGTGIEFTESLVGMHVDRVFVPSVEKGVHAACKEGVTAGYRVVDLKVDFYHGKQHPVDSKDVAFQIAGHHALKEAMLAAEPCLLEPIYHMEVTVPEESMGDVMSDISSRRGKIVGIDSNGRYPVIKAQMPQAEQYDFTINLRSLTRGQGSHTGSFSHYEEIPSDLEKKVISENRAS